MTICRVQPLGSSSVGLVLEGWFRCPPLGVQMQSLLRILVMFLLFLVRALISCVKGAIYFYFYFRAVVCEELLVCLDIAIFDFYSCGYYSEYWCDKL